MKKRILSTVIASAALTLSGCNSSMQTIQQNINQNTEVMNERIETARTGHASNQSSVRHNTGAFIPSHTIFANTSHHPSDSVLRNDVVFNGKVTSLRDAASQIAQLTHGIPVVAMTAENSPPAPAAANQQNESTFNFIPLNSNTTIAPTFNAPTEHNIHHNGSLHGLLDKVAATYNVYWGWDEARTHIRFFETDTRTFRIATLPGDTSASSSISGGSGSSGSQTASMNIGSLSVWEGIEAAINNMLSDKGKVTATPSTGTLTVSDNPHVLDKVAEYINSQNDIITRQVIVNVRVLSVANNNNEDYGVNWNAAFQNLSQTYNVALTGGSPGPSVSAMAFRIMGDENNPDSSINRWSGTDAAIRALSELGTVSQVTSSSVTTLNNQPAPVNVGRERGFVESTSVTVTENTSSTAITQGQIDTGYSMTFVPSVISDREMLLQMSIDISSLLELTSFASGGTVVQVPDVEKRNFMQRLRINSGDTLVVAGFEQVDNSMDMQGTGSVRNQLFGGGRRAASGSSSLVVIIEPIIVN